MVHITANDIVDWICIAMIILGTIGNSLGLIVFSSRKFRRTTYGRLAIASLIINLLCVYRYSILLHSKTRRWIQYKASESWFNCKLYRFSSCLRVLSAFVTVAWTYERFSYVTRNFHFFTTSQRLEAYKFYLMGVLSFIVVAILTGPTVYFYQPTLSESFKYEILSKTNATSTRGLINSTLLQNESSTLIHDKHNEISNVSYRMSCDFKRSIPKSWFVFLTDVRFGFNYTTFRAIFSEIVPSILVIFFNIAIIIRVIQATLSFSPNNSSMTIRQKPNGSYNNKDCVDRLIVHNRPRTSWMNIVLIIHSCLFFFSSLTATIVHWLTSQVLLSHSISVVILANCSLNFYVYCLSGRSFRNEIRKLLYDYFQIYCFVKFMNLFRTPSRREHVSDRVRMRLTKHRSIKIPQQTNQTRTPSFIQRYG